MRVLLVLGHSLPTQHALWEDVAQRDVDLHVAHTRDVPRDGALGPPVFGTPHQLAAVRVRGDRQTWMAYRKLRELIRRLQPDVVHVLNEPWSVVVSQVASQRGHRLITHGCENLWEQGAAPAVALRRALARRNLRASAGFVSWNRQGVKWARRWGLPTASPDLVLAAELPRLDRFTDVTSLRSAGRGDWAFSDEFAIGYVGRLVPEKGIDWLLRSWTAAGLSPNARLLFVGAGPMDSAVRAAALEDPRIRLVGAVPFERVPTVMASLDAIVLPSLTTPDWCEQYGRVITEAMAAGRPVIASRSGAIPEVVDDAGLLVPEASVADLAGAMARLESDGAERERLRRLGLARAATAFSPAVGATRLMEFWRSVVGTEVR